MFSPAPAGPSAAIPVSLATNAVKGVGAVRSVYTTDNNCGASNAACLNLVWEQGPYGGADPSDRAALFDVKRWNDGGLANKVFINGVKAQGAMEALHRAGVTTPFSSVAKRDATVAPFVFIDDGGNYSTAVYGTLPLDKQNYTGAASSTSVSAGYSPFPLVAKFPNGISLVGQPTVGGNLTSTPVTLNTGSCGKSTQVTYMGDYDPSSFDGQLPSNMTIPGVSLFSYPQAEGAITTLQSSGAQVIADLAANNIVGAINEANPSYMASQFPTPQMIPLPRTTALQTQAKTGLAVVPSSSSAATSPWTPQSTTAPFAYAVPFRRPCGFAL